MKPSTFKRGLLHGVPIFLGYLAVSFGFGISAVGMGLSIAETVLISMFNLTSAGQMAGAPIIAAGGSFAELAVSQLVINLRYSLMSVSLSQKLDERVRLPHRLLIAFANTDEVFAVSASQDGRVSRAYMYGLALLPILGWTGGTALGAVAGEVLPPIVTASLGVAIYGMFIAIVIPVTRRHLPTAACVLTAVGIGCLFRFVPALSAVSHGFVIIIAAVSASLLFAWLRPIPTEQEKGGDTP